MNDKARGRSSILEKSRAFNEALGAKIKALRLNSNLRQADLAARLGISYQQVQKYETGKDRCSAYALREIAAALDVPIAVLYEDFEAPTGTAPDIRQAMQTLAALRMVKNPGVRQRLSAVINHLADADKVIP